MSERLPCHDCGERYPIEELRPLHLSGEYGAREWAWLCPDCHADPRDLRDEDA